jgi:hypothetical protein
MTEIACTGVELVAGALIQARKREYPSSTYALGPIGLLRQAPLQRRNAAVL